MARFQKTLDNLQAIAGHMPMVRSLGTVGPQKSGDTMAELEAKLVEIFQREDARSVRIALLVQSLIAKYKGRAV